jgi:hypothetical protein
VKASRCLALLPSGEVCLADAVPGLRYCREHVSVRGMDRARLGQAIRQAMRAPDRYLAAVLAEWPDEDLAAELGADRHLIWQLRLCGYPRAERWAADVVDLALLVDADPRRLEALLRRLGVRPNTADDGP